MKFNHHDFGTSYAIFPYRHIAYPHLTPLNLHKLNEIQHLSNSIGYISYECYTDFENITPPSKPSFCNLPKFHFSQYTTSQTFNINQYQPAEIPHIAWVKSNMSKSQYTQGVNDILSHIKKGTCYQVNLTRKFYGEFSSKPNPFNILRKLYSVSPNPYSSLFYLNHNQCIISSSPECFISKRGSTIFSKPIKGSISSQSKTTELKNHKDQSENLMITDLVRNDLSRVSSKVWVENFQEIQTFSQIHHMVSTINGTLLPNINLYNCINATFPPGSMTGAPKIKAIEIANAIENQQRGIYSGCFGIVKEKDFDFSVTIRTIIIDGNKFEFQVGGGIVYDSTPEKELEETIIKAQPILQALNIKEDIFYE